MYSFAYGIDGRDWDAYRSIFVGPDDEITFDYESYSGRPAMRMTADEWVDAVRPLFDGLDATQHTMSNPIVEIDADGPARCRVYMQAAHFLWADDVAEPEFTIGGYYDDHLVLRRRRWNVEARRRATDRLVAARERGDHGDWPRAAGGRREDRSGVSADRTAR